MPKNNEFANRTNNSNPVSTVTHDTGKETFLTESNIRQLKMMFPDEETFIKHMETLWGLRALAVKACEQPDGAVNDKNPMFRIVQLSNQFIGALSQDNIIFECDGKKVYHWKR